LAPALSRLRVSQGNASMATIIINMAWAVALFRDIGG
jgi:hypothetical protein